MPEGAENCGGTRRLSGSPQKHRYPSTSSNSSGGASCSGGMTSFKRRKLSCQYEGCYMQFDSASLLNEHVRSCHVGLSSSAQLQSNVMSSVSSSCFDAHGSSPQDSLNDLQRHLSGDVNFLPTSLNSSTSRMSAEVRQSAKSSVPSICTEDGLDTSPVSAYGHFPCEVCGK